MNMEMRVGYKLSMIVGVMLMTVLLFMCLSVTGCGTLGNGKVDVPYDVSVTLALPNGDALSLVTDENGVAISGKYISPKTGIIYEIDPNGTITATDSLGNQIKLTPKG